MLVSRTSSSWRAVCAALALGGLAPVARAAVPLAKISDSLYHTEHVAFLIDTGGAVAWPTYSSVYSSGNLASYFNTVTTQFPGTYFSMCYLANNLSPNSVPIYTTQIFKATGIVTPGTPGAPQSSATVDYCRYNLGGGTVLPSALAVYDHEIGHAWGARILSVPGHWNGSSTVDCQLSATYTDDGGVTVKKIYGDPVNGFHWRALDSAQSNETELFADQELYLMGLEPTLPTFYELTSPVYHPDRTVSHSGATARTHADAVAAHGARNPDFRSSQKQFRLGFVYIARDLAEVTAVYDSIEKSAAFFCDSEAIDTTTYRFEVPFLVETKFRASVTGRYADLDGNSTPVLAVTDTYVSSSDGNATVRFTASDPDGVAPTVTLATSCAQATFGNGQVQFAGLPDGAHFFTLKATDAGGKKAFGHCVVEVQRAAGSTAITTHPAPATVNAGATVTFTVAASGSPASFTYRWWRQAAGTSTWNPLGDGGAYSGATTATLAVAGTTTMQGDRFLCFVDNGSSTATSSHAELTVLETAPTITTQPPSQHVASGTTVHFTIAAQGAPSTFGAFRYQWQRLPAGSSTWADVASGGGYLYPTSASLQVSSVTTGQDGDQFRCVVTNTAGSTTTNTAALNVSVRPTITTQPSSVTVATGQDATFSVGVSGTAPFTYQWKKYGVDVAGGTGATLTITAAQPTDAGAYTVTVTNAVGSAGSNVGSLTVTGAVAPGISTATSNQTVTAGSSATFSTTATGTAPLAYQWQRSTNNGGSWSNLADDATFGGVTTATLTVAGTTTGMSGHQFRVTVSNTAGSAFGNAATLTVNALVVAPSVTSQPADQSVTAGASASFSVTASGSATLTYQWARSTNGGAGWNNLADDSTYSGATTSSLAVAGTTLGMSGDQFRCTVTNSAGSATTAAGTLTVAAAPVAPSIATPPASATVTAGQTASFSVTASGTAPLTYQWRLDGSPITGATSATYAIAAAQAGDAGSYTVAVTNVAGSVTSTTATLTVNPAPVAPTIVSQPGDVAVAAGGAASFGVSASGTAPFTYQWSFNGAAIPGATSVTYAIAAAQSSDAGAYSVVVANVAGSANSNLATLTVGAATVAPSITGQPQSATVTAGGAASFSVSAGGTAPLTYQWRFNGAPISGATSAMYSIAAAQSGDAGSYTVVVTNAAGSATSNAATLTVAAAPGGGARVTRLAGISTRSLVGTGFNVQVGGFVISGPAPKRVAIRASGPALAGFGLGGTLADPQLGLYSGITLLQQNDDWHPGDTAEFARLGMFTWATGSKDAALVLTLDPGAYTAQVAGAGGGTGVALIEIYDGDAPTAAGRLVGISTRSLVGTGGEIQIGGFVIDGDTPRRVAIRANGPALAAYGVPGPLADPVINLYAGTTVIASNDDWDAALAADFTALGMAAWTSGSKDAALLVTLAPGAYTAQVSGKNGGTGVALLEIYEAP